MVRHVQDVPDRLHPELAARGKLEDCFLQPFQSIPDHRPDRQHRIHGEVRDDGLDRRRLRQLQASLTDPGFHPRAELIEKRARRSTGVQENLEERQGRRHPPDESHRKRLELSRRQPQVWRPEPLLDRAGGRHG